MDMKKTIIDICYDEGITRRYILAEYNKKYNKNVQENSFNRMINTGNIKYRILQDVLDAIGYTITIQKKCDNK